MRGGRRWTRPPYKSIVLVAPMVMVLIGVGVYSQFRRTFTPKDEVGDDWSTDFSAREFGGTPLNPDERRTVATELAEAPN
jgi:hypothetical protein